jgi:hypothetical protein
MDAAASIYYYVRLGALGLVIVSSLLMVVVQLRRRKYSTVRRVVLACVSVAGVFALWAASGVVPSWLWIGGLMAVGAGLGWVAGRMSRAYLEDGAVKVKRSAFAPVLAAVASVLAAFTLLFGTSYLFAIALLVLAFSGGLSAGSAVAEAFAVRALTAVQPGAPTQVTASTN